MRRELRILQDGLAVLGLQLEPAELDWLAATGASVMQAKWAVIKKKLDDLPVGGSLEPGDLEWVKATGIMIANQKLAALRAMRAALKEGESLDPADAEHLAKREEDCAKGGASRPLHIYIYKS